MNIEELWQAVLAQVQLKISPANYATWFRNTTLLTLKDGEVLVSVPNSFTKEWFENKYHKLILKILHGLNEEIKGVKYVVGQPIKKIKQKEYPSPLPEVGQLEFQQFQRDKETNLNPRYTFDNFVVGAFNELAHAASWAVAQSPGSVYNPLFIYGGVGLGKTHLLQAIGNRIFKDYPEKKINYLPAEKFISEIVEAIKNRHIEGLKSRYISVDVIILDDVQFLAGKEKTQEEFFHIFNALYEKNKQIVISSDRPPKAIPALVERLRSRFEGGMVGDIGYPDIETRIAILKAKAQEKNVEIPAPVLNYLANYIQKNIRELEGALNRLIVYQKINNRFPDLETSKSLLKNIIHSFQKTATPQKIIQVVSEFYDLSEKSLVSLSRKREIVRARQIAMYLLREDLKSSFSFIAKKFGDRDHTTAIYACEKISQELNENENLVNEINLIRQRVLSE